MEKRNVWRTIEYDFNYDRSIDDIVDDLNNLRGMHLGKPLRSEKDYHSDYTQHDIQFEDIETDQEHNNRINDAAATVEREKRVLADLIARHPTEAANHLDKLKEFKAKLAMADAKLIDAINNANNKDK
jgi:hypothetical protein